MEDRGGELRKAKERYRSALLQCLYRGLGGTNACMRGTGVQLSGTRRFGGGRGGGTQGGEGQSALSMSKFCIGAHPIHQVWERCTPLWSQSISNPGSCASLHFVLGRGRGWRRRGVLSSPFDNTALPCFLVKIWIAMHGRLISRETNCCTLEFDIHQL